MRHGESVCLAGFRTDQVMTSSWIRLYPLNVRDLPADAAVRTWDEVDLRMIKAQDDHRPESYTPDRDSISVVGSLDTKRSWEARRSLVSLLPQAETMREVLALQGDQGISLSIVHPGQVLDLEITQKPPGEIAELRQRADRLASQGGLFDTVTKEPLEPIPLNFHYLVRYPDDPEPRRLKLIDWEINQTWRKWRNLYEDPEQRMREKWLNEKTGPSREALFFVGNQKRFPQQFLLLGIFSPPKLT